MPPAAPLAIPTAVAANTGIVAGKNRAIAPAPIAAAVVIPVFQIPSFDKVLSSVSS
jgi:hypothetical protein